jgi:hypothetical protein
VYKFGFFSAEKAAPCWGVVKEITDFHGSSKRVRNRLWFYFLVETPAMFSACNSGAKAEARNSFNASEGFAPKSEGRDAK